ncbi:MAG: hypothetical protein JO356_10850, partial [Acidobacteria bacterium]|nr:hypothetical protein [Acidobacteriota bacterium]
MNHASLDHKMIGAGPFPSAIYALGSVCAWGIADFIGGYAARRFHAFFLTTLGHFSGTLLVAGLAFHEHEPFPPATHL